MSQDNATPNLPARLRALASGHGSQAAIRLYTLAYVLVITALFSGAVAALHSALEGTRKANEEASRQATLLTMLGVIEPDANLSGAALAKEFESSVRVTSVSGIDMVGLDGLKAPYTYYSTYGNADLKVIPIWGSGFWGFMAGYAAINESAGEFRAVEFIRHEETPGLGGRIGDEDVKARCQGVTFLSPDSR
ncbi:MAG: hypothetical protein ACYTGH_18485, partial [Planctomycetota bacterium]